ncbi:hypothetical protein ACFRJ9_08355 [Paenarthrobacter sp. NPDC056912]|uniref:hypothetical protein n=1 Tax=Paenarthrobacter sp. NPDC056912 TaxID=3345965 RepID=UPI00366C8F5D
MKKTITLFLGAALGSVSLSGCSSTQNEGPCKDFERMYNAVDLRDKLIVVDWRGEDYRPSLKKLAATAGAGAAQASGEVKSNLDRIVQLEDMYTKTATGADVPYSFLDVRGWLDDARDKLVDACSSSGYAIALEPDHPVR